MVFSLGYLGGKYVVGRLYAWCTADSTSSERKVFSRAGILGDSASCVDNGSVRFYAVCLRWWKFGYCADSAFTIHFDSDCVGYHYLPGTLELTKSHRHHSFGGGARFDGVVIAFAIYCAHARKE